MRKFSNLGTPAPKVALTDPYALAVTKLLETLHMQVEGAVAPWQQDVRLVPGEAFEAALATLVNMQFHAEKKALLERAKQTAFTQDASWVDDALDALNEAKN